MTGPMTNEIERLREDLSALQGWLREPDYADKFGSREIVDWINRRPTHVIPKALAALSTQPDPDDDVVERVARALAVAAGYADYQWNSHGFKVHSLEGLARAALAAAGGR